MKGPRPLANKIYIFPPAGVICKMQNAMLNVKRDYSLLGQRKYIHAKINPNPNSTANHKFYPNPKITQREQMESCYGRDYRKVGDIRKCFR